MHIRVAVAVAFLLVATGLAPGVGVAAAGMQIRPTAGGDLAYETPARSFAGEHVVVHWVSRGPGAPPLNDDDADTIPDFVEHVASSADQALDFYAARGFRMPLPDSGGPDARPDLYIAELPFGVFGFMAPASVSWDGAFVVLSAQLDRREPVSLGNLRATTGHELFHVVQQAYVGDLPPWVAEGTADALASLAAPDVHDFADELRQTRWASRADGTIADNDPYAASAFWRYIEQRAPGTVAALLEARARIKPMAESSDPSWYRTLESVYRARGKGSLDAAFARWARELLLERVLGTAGTVRPGEYRISTCSPMSIRVLRLSVPAATRIVDVEVNGVAGSTPHVQLVLPTGRTILARDTGRGSARLHAKLRPGEHAGVRLVVTGRALGSWASSAKVRLVAS